MTITKPVPGRWLQELREAADLTLREVAERSGKDLNWVKRRDTMAAVPEAEAQLLVNAIITEHRAHLDRWRAAAKSPGVVTNYMTGQSS